jgi:hypothetical protein
MPFLPILFFCQQIIERHEGKMDVPEENDGYSVPFWADQLDPSEEIQPKRFFI